MYCQFSQCRPYKETPGCWFYCNENIKTHLDQGLEKHDLDHPGSFRPAYTEHSGLHYIYIYYTLDT